MWKGTCGYFKNYFCLLLGNPVNSHVHYTAPIMAFCYVTPCFQIHYPCQQLSFVKTSDCLIHRGREEGGGPHLCKKRAWLVSQSGASELADLFKKQEKKIPRPKAALVQVLAFLGLALYTTSRRCQITSPESYPV